MSIQPFTIAIPQATLDDLLVLAGPTSYPASAGAEAFPPNTSKTWPTHILIGVSRELVECKKSAPLVEPMGEPSSDFTACAS